MVLLGVLNPACSGQTMDLDYTNQLRRLVTSLSKSLPMQEVRLIGRYELASFAGFPGFRRGNNDGYFPRIWDESVCVEGVEEVEEVNSVFR